MQLHPVDIWSLLLSDRNHCWALSCLIYLWTINSIDEIIKSILSKFMGNTKLGECLSAGCGKALQRNLYRLDQWAEAKWIRFNKAVPGPTLQSQQLQGYRLGVVLNSG